MTHLGIVLGRSGAWPLAIGLAVAAADVQHRTVIFAMDQACGGTQLPLASQLQQLLDSGVELVFCGTSIDACGTQSLIPSDALIGSQLDHAQLVQRAQRLVALT
jgi:predicted peroxiredoxin